MFWTVKRMTRKAKKARQKIEKKAFKNILSYIKWAASEGKNQVRYEFEDFLPGRTIEKIDKKLNKAGYKTELLLTSKRSMLISWK